MVSLNVFEYIVWKWGITFSELSFLLPQCFQIHPRTSVCAKGLNYNHSLQFPPRLNLKQIILKYTCIIYKKFMITTFFRWDISYMNRFVLVFTHKVDSSTLKIGPFHFFCPTVKFSKCTEKVANNPDFRRDSSLRGWAVSPESVLFVKIFNCLRQWKS